jgi:hypothetical protein
MAYLDKVASPNKILALTGQGKINKNIKNQQ